MLTQKIAEAIPTLYEKTPTAELLRTPTPELISATPELISATPELISAVPATNGLMAIAVFAVVGIMAVVTLWQTAKLVKIQSIAHF